MNHNSAFTSSLSDGLTTFGGNAKFSDKKKDPSTYYNVVELNERSKSVYTFEPFRGTNQTFGNSKTDTKQESEQEKTKRKTERLEIP